MKELFLNGAELKTADDVYDAFFKAVGAPSWHGKNFNALNDSIADGNINDVGTTVLCGDSELQPNWC